MFETLTGISLLKHDGFFFFFCKLRNDILLTSEQEMHAHLFV